MKTIKAGCGYWEIDRYPIGGCFRRAPRNGTSILLTDITGPVDSSKGRVYLATTDAGARVAVSPDCVI